MNKFFVLLFLLIPSTAFSQTSIQGVILEEFSNQPIAGANVYLAGTLIGDASNQKGEFLLEGIPKGAYDLIVSHVGYEDAIKTISIQADGSLNLEIPMKVKTEELQEVTLQATDDDRAYNYALFRKASIGDNQPSAQVGLDNDEALFFFFDQTDYTLFAHSNQPLSIKNEALGYRIFYDLKNFQMHLRQGRLNLAGIPRFEELTPKGKGEAKRWAKARKRAYLGSFEHFLKAAKKNTLEEEGFSVREVVRMPVPGRPTQAVIDAKVAKFKKDFNALLDRSGEGFVIKDGLYPEYDSLQYWRSWQRSPAYEDSLGRAIDDSHELLDSSKEKVAYQGILEIVYWGEGEEKQYAISTRPGGVADRKQTTKVYFLLPFELHDNGYYNPASVLFEGYMGWNGKLSTLLPLDYIAERFRE